MVTIGMAVPSKYEKTAMQAVAQWDMVVDEVGFKVVMEHAEAMAVPVEATEAVVASVVVVVTLVEATEEGTEEEAAAAVLLAVAAVVMAAVSRNKLHLTLSPTLQRPEEREARLSMPEM
jgi:hypothetical protein